MVDSIRPNPNPILPSGGTNNLSVNPPPAPAQQQPQPAPVPPAPPPSQGLTAVTGQPGLQAMASAAQIETARPAQQAQAAQSQQNLAAAQKAAAQAKQNASAQDISLKFRTDEDTGETTIYVVDRQSKKVLRTIPPSDINKLSAGELINLTT